jgi:hypothetical protein
MIYIIVELSTIKSIARGDSASTGPLAVASENRDVNLVVASRISNIWVNYTTFAAEKIVSCAPNDYLVLNLIRYRMAAPSRRFAVACLALFAVMAAGCMISRPCNWDEWRYQSSDGRHRGHDDWDGSPPLVLDQQARARPHGDCPDFRLSENGTVPFKAGHSEKSPAKPKVAQKPIPSAVATVQWQESVDMPPNPKKGEPKRPRAVSVEAAKPTATPAARSQQHPQVAGPTDRTPFNWGFFGAETRW